MLFRILILLFALLIIPDAYIYFVHVRQWTQRWWLRLLAFLPSLALLTYMLLVLRTDDMHAEHQASVGLFMIIFLAVTVPRMLFTIIDGIGHIGKGLYRRVMRILAMAVAFFSLLLLAYGYFSGRNRYVVHQQTLYFTNLPRNFDGYRVALFTDMHLGTLADGHQQDAQRIVNLINDQNCDLILFGGDLVNYQACELDGYDKVLGALQAPDGVCAVMGNHDYSMYIHTLTEAEKKADIEELQRRERNFGWKLLLNDHAVISRGADSIAIIGVENDGRAPFPSLGDLPRATKGLRGVMRSDNRLGDHTFSILLSHDPTHWRRRVIPDTRIDLTLSGHTHAGQFKVFGWSPVAFVYDEWSGLYSEGSQILNISDGVGQVMFPFRFGAWPEINVITLKRSK